MKNTNRLTIEKEIAEPYLTLLFSFNTTSWSDNLSSGSTRYKIMGAMTSSTIGLNILNTATVISTETVNLD